MAVSITADGIQFANGTQSSAGRIVTFDYVEYGVRQSTPGQTGYTDLWTANSFTRKFPNSYIRVRGFLPGNDDFSYPYGGTYVSLTSPDGSLYRTHVGSHYMPQTQGEQSVYWHVDATFHTSASNGVPAISTETGTWTVRYGYGSNSGNGNKPWEDVWNPNSSDDGRAYQTYSVSMVEEFIL